MEQEKQYIPSQEELGQWKRDAEQGDAEAQYLLGYCYFNGTNGAEKNYEKAVYWYRKAAEQGDTYVQNLLGECYEYGKGVKIDYVEAEAWYIKAGVFGDQGLKRVREKIKQQRK